MKQDEAPETSNGGIIIHSKYQEKPFTGQVLATGPGLLDVETDERVPCELKPGDRVIFDKYAGVSITLGGKDYLIMPENQVYGTIEGDNA